MRIAIDVSAMLGVQGGMRVYLEQLLEHLARIDRDNEYFLCLARWKNLDGLDDYLRRLNARNFSAHARRFPFTPLLLLENRLGLRIQEKFLLPEIDLYHGACQVIPPLAHARSVMTVHHYDDPRYRHAGWWQKFYYNKVYKDSIRRAGHFIADSQFTKRFLMESESVSEDRITVIYHGIFDPRPEATPEKLAALTREFDLPERFVLCVSHMHQRKNTLRLIGAFKKLSARLPDVSLVLVGGGEQYYIDQVKGKVKELELERKVKFTGVIRHEKVPLFCAAASLFVLPSILEGFGIPLIEAMAMGCPVAGADATAIPEVIADAGLLFDPEDEDETADKMREALENSKLRNELVQKGLRRASQFSWQNAARDTLAVYRRMLAS